MAWVRRHWIISLLGALFIAFIAYKILTPSEPDYEYVTADVTRGNVVKTVSASGKLRALNTINVGSEISGQVTNVYVDFNSPVTAGQLLAEIDATRPRAQVTQARAQVELARATLAQAQAAIRRAQTDVEVQTREYARRKQLQAKGFVSGAGLDQAENNLVTAKASLSTARAQAQSARAQIAQSSAQLASAQLDLNRTRIIAPSSGVVINKLVEPGTTVAANFQTPNLFEIASDTSRMQVEASVDEADIGQVKEGQPVRFTVDSYPDEIFKAVVQQIRKSANEAQNAVSYLVILDVDNKDGKLLTGMTANVEIETGRKTDVLRIPTSSTRFRPRPEDQPASDDADGNDNQDDEEKRKKSDGTFVWLKSEDAYKPIEKKIDIGLVGEDFTEVKKGLSAQDIILLRVRNFTPAQDAEQ